MSANDSQSVGSNAGQSPAQETAPIGNKAAAHSEVVFASGAAVATFIGVRWDGDKVRGIRIELSDGSSKQAGGYDDGGYTLSEYHFAAGEKLVTAFLRELRIRQRKPAPDRAPHVFGQGLHRRSGGLGP